ncbi:MAG: TetR family transcriptional regulator [Gammaproteobacteria bacterium]|nr:TetR family transcriptional regulator [Gammaproteobacteria bacterium]
MPRRTQEDTAKTRQCILDKALEIFLKQGYSLTRLEDIANAAHVTRGAIYWHFKSGKVAIYETLINESGQDLEDLLHRIMNTSQTGATKLKQFMLGWADLLVSQPVYRQVTELILFKTEVIPELEQGVQQKRESMLQFQQLLSRWLSDEYQPKQADELASIVLASCWGLIEYWLLMHQNFPLSERTSLLLNRLISKGD